MVRALPDPIRGLQDRSRLIANPCFGASESYPARLMQCGAHAHHRPDCQSRLGARHPPHHRQRQQPADRRPRQHRHARADGGAQPGRRACAGDARQRRHPCAAATPLVARAQPASEVARRRVPRYGAHLDGRRHLPGCALDARCRRGSHRRAGRRRNAPRGGARVPQHSHRRPVHRHQQRLPGNARVHHHRHGGGAVRDRTAECRAGAGPQQAARCEHQRGCAARHCAGRRRDLDRPLHRRARCGSPRR